MIEIYLIKVNSFILISILRELIKVLLELPSLYGLDLLVTQIHPTVFVQFPNGNHPMEVWSLLIERIIQIGCGIS
jgi:hypothetical protein